MEDWSLRSVYTSLPQELRAELIWGGGDDRRGSFDLESIIEQQVGQIAKGECRLHMLNGLRWTCLCKTCSADENPSRSRSIPSQAGRQSIGVESALRESMESLPKAQSEQQAVHALPVGRPHKEILLFLTKRYYYF